MSPIIYIILGGTILSSMMKMEKMEDGSQKVALLVNIAIGFSIMKALFNDIYRREDSTKLVTIPLTLTFILLITSTIYMWTLNAKVNKALQDSDVMKKTVFKNDVAAQAARNIWSGPYTVVYVGIMNFVSLICVIFALIASASFMFLKTGWRTNILLFLLLIFYLVINIIYMVKFFSFIKIKNKPAFKALDNLDATIYNNIIKSPAAKPLLDVLGKVSDTSNLLGADIQDAFKVMLQNQDIATDSHAIARALFAINVHKYLLKFGASDPQTATAMSQTLSTTALVAPASYTPSNHFSLSGFDIKDESTEFVKQYKTRNNIKASDPLYRRLDDAASECKKNTELVKNLVARASSLTEAQSLFLNLLTWLTAMQSIPIGSLFCLFTGIGPIDLLRKAATKVAGV